MSPVKPVFTISATIALTGVAMAQMQAARSPCEGTDTVPALATVEVTGERFVVRVTEQDLLDQMRDVCLGLAPRLIVGGALATGHGGFNRDPQTGIPWSWHIKEEQLFLGKVWIELCDGRPSFVEADLEE